MLLEVAVYPVSILYALVLVVLPDPGDIPTLTAGESAIITRGGDGYGWVRILEDDYICLLISTDSPAHLAVYDDSGDLLVATSPGEDALVSAFSDYWFNVRVDPGGSDQLTLYVDEEPATTLGSSGPTEGVLSISRMARAYTFVPSSRGRWQIALTGEGTTDLDLEVYGPRMNIWTAGYSGDGNEKVLFNALSAETLTVVVSRYNKSGSGEYILEASRVGDFRRLDGTWTGLLESDNAIQRVLIAPRPEPAFLHLSCGEPGADIDLLVMDGNGEKLWSASSYSADEALLLRAGNEDIVAQVVAWDFADADRLRFSLSVEPLTVTGMESASSVVQHVGEDPPIGFTPGNEGFFVVEAIFDKFRDGEVSLFRNSGEPSIVFSTERGDERFLAWIGEGDTVWLYPYFQETDRAGACTLSISPISPPNVDGFVSGVIGGDVHEAFYTASVTDDAILVIRLEGDERETDLDMLVSGENYDLTAEGWLSSVDDAGDESVALSALKGTVFGVTVYGYERDSEGGYSLTVQQIPRTPLNEGSGDMETWALLAGISGYMASVDVLSRASMDALDFYTFLTVDQEIPSDHVILLVDAMATADAFRSSLRELLSRAGPEDRVIVFFSGHGTQYEPGSGGAEELDSANECICLYDEDIEDDWLAEVISEQASAPVLLFVDACNSGGLVNDFTPGSNVLILTAAREDRSVSERVLTPILLEGCRGGADRDQDGVVSASELTDYVDERLQRICPDCDVELVSGSAMCPDCGAVLKGENRVPRPEQGMFLSEDLQLWLVNDGKDAW